MTKSLLSLLLLLVLLVLFPFPVLSLSTQQQHKQQQQLALQLLRRLQSPSFETVFNDAVCNVVTSTDTDFEAFCSLETGEDETNNNNNTSNNNNLVWFDNAGNILHQPEDFYGSSRAIEIAETVLLYQNPITGGWNKNYDRIDPILPVPSSVFTYSTIDNDATTTEIRYLSRVYRHVPLPKYRIAIQRGIQFLLDSQYNDDDTNGGWPQRYPPGTQYHRHITFNDNAMMNVMELLYDILRDANTTTGSTAATNNETAIMFPSEIILLGNNNDDNNNNNNNNKSTCLYQRIATALQRGFQTILQTQIRVNGDVLTAWCAQHDVDTLLPVQARSYEPPSIGGDSSVAIVQFLMKLQYPTAAVIVAITRAMEWFYNSRMMITGNEDDENDSGSDQQQYLVQECYWNENIDDIGRWDYRLAVIEEVVNNNHTASSPVNTTTTTPPLPLWARFYDLETGLVPLYQDRNGTIFSHYDDLSYGRRTGYRYHTKKANRLFCIDYPEWIERMNMLPFDVAATAILENDIPEDLIFFKGQHGDGEEDVDDNEEEDEETDCLVLVESSSSSSNLPSFFPSFAPSSLTTTDTTTATTSGAARSPATAYSSYFYQSTKKQSFLLVLSCLLLLLPLL